VQKDFKITKIFVEKLDTHIPNLNG